MVANKILWAKKKKKKKMRNCVLHSWLQFSRSSSAFFSKIPSWNSLSDARRIYTHEGLAQATWVSLERDSILHAKESFLLGRDVLKPMSRLGEQEYFELKKGSRLGEIGSIWARLGENGSKRGSPLHELSLKREFASLKREWRLALA